MSLSTGAQDKGRRQSLCPFSNKQPGRTQAEVADYGGHLTASIDSSELSGEGWVSCPPPFDQDGGGPTLKAPAFLGCLSWAQLTMGYPALRHVPKKNKDTASASGVLLLREGRGCHKRARSARIRMDKQPKFESPRSVRMDPPE